jgi:hypothetical protein
MQKVIYNNESSKLIANYNGGVVEFIQYLDDEIVGMVSMYAEEVTELSEFLNQIELED